MGEFVNLKRRHAGMLESHRAGPVLASLDFHELTHAPLSVVKVSGAEGNKSKGWAVGLAMTDYTAVRASPAASRDSASTAR